MATHSAVMKISYCFPDSPRLASWRYRIKIPSQELRKLGFQTSTGTDGDVVFFAKHFGDLELAEKCDKPIIFDWCDDHTGDRFAQHYRQMANLATVVTCPTQVMKQVIFEDTGREAVVISDPYEYPEQSPKKPGEKLFWFGHQSNLHTLKGLDLNGYRVAVLTGDAWSYENMLKCFKETDMVIIPTNPEKQYKSPNRMVESIRQGHYVVSGPMPAYIGYRMWLGDIREGLAWAINHPEEVKEAILEGQEIVRERNSPEVIGAEWAKLLKSL